MDDLRGHTLSDHSLFVLFSSIFALPFQHSVSLISKFPRKQNFLIYLIFLTRSWFAYFLQRHCLHTYWLRPIFNFEAPRSIFGVCLFFSVASLRNDQKIVPARCSQKSDLPSSFQQLHKSVGIINHLVLTLEAPKKRNLLIEEF